MIERLIRIAVVRWAGSPRNSWLYTSAALGLYRGLRRFMGRRAVVEQFSLVPGQTYVVESLEVTHKDQIKQIKQENKALDAAAAELERVRKKQAKEDKRRRRSDAKQYKQDARQAKREGKRSRAEAPSKPSRRERRASRSED